MLSCPLRKECPKTVTVRFFFNPQSLKTPKHIYQSKLKSPHSLSLENTSSRSLLDLGATWQWGQSCSGKMCFAPKSFSLTTRNFSKAFFSACAGNYLTWWQIFGGFVASREWEFVGNYFQNNILSFEFSPPLKRDLMTKKCVFGRGKFSSISYFLCFMSF